MGILPWDLKAVFSTALPVRAPRLTVRCEYADLGMPPTEVTFSLSPRYGIHNAREAHDWFLLMMHAHEEFEVDTDRAGELLSLSCLHSCRFASRSYRNVAFSLR